MAIDKEAIKEHIRGILVALGDVQQIVRASGQGYE